MDEFIDLMGITIETGDPWLDKKLNSHICYKGGGGSTTTVEKSDPWEKQQPYLAGGGGKPIYSYEPNPNYDPNRGEGARAYSPLGPGWDSPNSSKEFIKTITGYEGGTPGVFPEASRIYQEQLERGGYVPEFAAQTLEGFQGIEELARGGTIDDALQYNQDVVNGDYMMGGDRFQQAYGNTIQDQLNAQFSRSGRTNSGYHSDTIAQGLGDAAARQWNTDHAARRASSMLLPGLYDRAYGDQEALIGVGDAHENLRRLQFGADVNNQWDSLSKYNNIIQGNYGGTNTSENPLYRNQGAGILGGAATGAGIASMFGVTGVPGLAAAGLLGAGIGAF